MNVEPARPEGTNVRRAGPGRIPGGRPRAAALLAALLMAVGSLLFAPAQTATAAGNGEWSVDPYVPDGTNQNTRRYFFLEGAAGTTLSDVVSIANTSGRPLTFKLFGADAYNTPRDGGFALRLVNEPQTDVGQWIQVPEEYREFTLEDQQRIQIPFTITIPANATPGDHIGGVVALNTAIEGEQQQGPIQVKIQRQIGARIYLRVAGPTLPAIDIQDVRVERDTGFGQFFGSSKATIHYTVVNRGNVMVRPELELSAKGLFGRTLLEKDKAPLGFELLPGQKVELKQIWKDAPRLDSVDLKVKVTTQQDGQTLGDEGKASFVAVPWPSLLVLALLLIVGGVAWRLMRGGSGGGKSGDGAAPKDPKSPADGESSDDAADAAAKASAADGAKSGQSGKSGDDAKDGKDKQGDTGDKGDGSGTKDAEPAPEPVKAAAAAEDAPTLVQAVEEAPEPADAKDGKKAEDAGKDEPRSEAKAGAEEKTTGTGAKAGTADNTDDTEAGDVADPAGVSS